MRGSPTRRWRWRARRWRWHGAPRRAGLQADALVELASVLHGIGLVDEAQPALAEGIALYEAKGDRVSARLAAARI